MYKITIFSKEKRVQNFKVSVKESYPTADISSGRMLALLNKQII
jgi:hypothetical protein